MSEKRQTDEHPNQKQKENSSNNARTARKKRGIDFLKDLAGLNFNTKPKVIKSEHKNETKHGAQEEIDILKDIQEIGIEGSIIDYDSWFNDEDHDFNANKSEYKMYRMKDYLLYSTISHIPPTPVTLHQIIKDFNINTPYTNYPTAPIIFDYHDFLYVSSEISDHKNLIALHVANTIVSTNFIQENNSNDKRVLNYTSTTILVLCPMKKQAYEFISEVLNCLPINSQDGNNMIIENENKFNNEYNVELPNYMRTKSADYVETFGGNTDQDFIIGLNFSSKKVVLYSNADSSQMIVASPLAIMNLENPDFLSSIEVLVLDSLDTLLIQNSKSCFSVISKLNGLPSSINKTKDWNKLRNYCANKQHIKMRQSIGYATVLTPEMVELFSNFQNIRGSVILRPLKYCSVIIPRENQYFHRIQCENHDHIGESHYNNFIQAIIPLIKKWRSDNSSYAKRTIIYFVSSMRFYQIRKYIDEQSIMFLELGDAASYKDMKNMNQAFNKDPNSVLLITERFYFHHRLAFKNVGRTLFIGPPTYPQFVGEVAGSEETHFYFTKYDEYSLERIVGSSRVQQTIDNENPSIF